MAYIRKMVRSKGITYKAEVAGQNGSKKSKTFRTAEDAKTWARQQETIRENQKHSGIVTCKITLNDYFEKWFEDYAKYHHSPGWQITDRQMYRDYVAPLLGMRELREIHTLDIQKVLTSMINKRLAKSYANRLRQLLHKMFNEAVSTYHYLTSNPVSSTKPYKEIPKVTNSFPEAEARMLLEWADTQELGVILHVALQLGLREGELVGLKWDAVDLDLRTLTVRRKFEKKTKVMEEFAKGKKIRMLGLYPDGLLQRLKERKAKVPFSQFVVSNPDGTMLTPNQLIFFLKKGIKATGISRVTVHGLRHTFASLYMQHGGDLYDLQKLMGHASVSTTERYRHTDPEYLKQKCKILDLYSNSAQIPPTPEKPALRLVGA